MRDAFLGCGYDVEEVYVLYDRKAMIEHIINSDMPTKAKIQRRIVVLE